MKKHKRYYFIITLILLSLSWLYFSYPVYRLVASILIGTVYFFSAIILHIKDNTLHLSIVLEYFVISLLGITILIFISLRA